MDAGIEQAYKYRIAFGVWINDMRTEPLPLENWPAPQLDDMCVDSIVRAMDVQSEAGFTMLDVWGLFATYGWPPDIISALDEDRTRRVRRLLRAAADRDLCLSLGFGTYSWGYDRIIEADPEVRGRQADGTPHPHAMCDASPRSFEYVTRILDFVFSEFDFGAVHLESCDLGCCHCPHCAGKDGVVAHNVRLNAKTADYIKSRWPDKTVYSITINWIPAMTHFNAQELEHVAQLSGHVDCIFDQGHVGFHVAQDQRREFISRLQCAYGTSGPLWLYPDARWDRASYFLPFTRRCARGLQSQFADGVRGCMYYQGPVVNPGTEVNIAVGGRILADVTRDVEDALAEVLERLYRPRSPEALKLLVSIFQRAEDTYFDQWSAERFAKQWGTPAPGEFKLDQHLFGTLPGPATYLTEPSLDAAGRQAYQAGLLSILEDLPKLQGQCDDGGRLERIQKAAIITMNMLSTVKWCLKEA